LFGFLVGGLVYGDTFGRGIQYHEWTSFISDNEFCFRACIGPKATVNCNHIYDVMGCFWVRRYSHFKFSESNSYFLQNMPANYNAGTFENCDANDEYVYPPSFFSSWLNHCFLNSLPMGVYGTSTWFQGVKPTPPPHPAASSSNCQALPSVTVSPAKAKRSNGGFEKRFVARFPEATAPPMRRWD
jgi:hypothetical protein